MRKSNERMGFLVSKWGNSLAVRLPAESAKRIGVGEGDKFAMSGLQAGVKAMAIAPIPGNPYRAGESQFRSLQFLGQHLGGVIG